MAEPQSEKLTSSGTSAQPMSSQVPETESVPLEIERTFQAPVSEVWKAWSTPDLIEQWWGPEGFTSPEARTEFHVGGQYVFAMRSPDGQQEFWTTGNYLEIEDQKKVVFTDQFSDSSGNLITAADAGMSGNWPDTLRVTVTFDEVDGKTRMKLVHEGLPRDFLEECRQGWGGSLDKMQKLVEKH